MMKSILLCFMSLLCVLFSMAQNANIPDSNAFVRVSRSDPRYFELSNGKTFIPVGPNICFPRFETDEEKVFDLYEKQFKKLSENGGNYTRIYLAAPFWEVEHEKAGAYDPKIAARLTRLMALAKKYGIRIKFNFEQFRRIEGKSGDFAYSIPFVKPIYSIKNGGPLESVGEFFNTEKGRAIYLNRLKFFTGLFGNEPQVFAWELWNEINSVGVKDLDKWTETMLAEAHKIFPNSMVVQNLGSFYRYQHRKVYQLYSTMAGNDFAQIHRYLLLYGDMDVCNGPMDVLTSDAINELLKYVTDRPVILAEVGTTWANGVSMNLNPGVKINGPVRLYEKDKEGILLHDILFAPFFSGSAGPGQCWHWQVYIDNNDLWWHYGRFSEAVKDFDPVAQKAVPVRLDQQHFRVYVLKGQSENLIWVRDTNCNWKTELEDRIKAPLNHAESLDTWPMKIPDNVKVSLYDPWKDRWIIGEIRQGKIALPDFIRSIIIRIEK
ncbi:MAG: hypothetical protein AB2L24_11040 [Mangrovibacterium sp.]